MMPTSSKLGHTTQRSTFSTATRNARYSLTRSLGILEGLRDLVRTSPSERTEPETETKTRASICTSAGLEQTLGRTEETTDQTSDQTKDQTTDQTTDQPNQESHIPQACSNRTSQSYFTPPCTPTHRTITYSPFPSPSTPTTSSSLSPFSTQGVDGMSRKLKKGTRGLFSRFFVKPYESIQTHGSVHNLARVGGVSVLCLPVEFAACDLVIPTRFAACGQFLVDVGEFAFFLGQ